MSELPLDAAEDDPDAGAVAELPGHGADERVTPDHGAGGAGAPAQQPPVGPPAQDTPPR